MQAFAVQPASGAGWAGGELLTDDGRDACSQYLDGSQHLLMRKRRDTHLERDASDAAEDFIHVEYFFSDSLGITNQQRPRGSAHCIELCSGRWRPAAFLADFGERVCVPGVKIVRGLLRGVSKEADGVETYDEFIGRVTCAPACLAIQVDKGTEPFGFATDDSDHKRQSKHTGTSERFWGAADTNPNGQRVLQRTRVDRWAGHRRPVSASPVNVRVLANLEEQIKLLCEKLVVVFETQTEQRIGFHERAATGNDFSTAMR